MIPYRPNWSIHVSVSISKTVSDADEEPSISRESILQGCSEYGANVITGKRSCEPVMVDLPPNNLTTRAA